MKIRNLFVAILIASISAGCVDGPQVKEPKEAEPAKNVEVEAVKEVRKKIRRERPQSLREARAQAAARVKALEEKRKGAKGSLGEAAKVDSPVMQKYLKLLELPGTPEERKPEILLRLAELAYRREEAALKSAYEEGTDMDILPGDKYPRTIGFYRTLADDYPSSEQALTAMYNLGYLYGEEGEVVLSARYYGKVLELSPDTPYATEIHMRMGESAFNLGIYREAVDHYSEVLSSGREEYRAKALYKLGWSYYKLDMYPVAIETFSHIMDEKTPQNRTLKGEALDIMGRTFVEWEGVDGVVGYLDGREAGKEYGDLLFKVLGDLYMEGSRHKDAVRAYETGTAAYPLTEVAFPMERGIINGYLAMQDPEAANLRRQLWYDLYRPGTPWDEGKSEELRSERDERLEEGLRLAALYRHSKAQRGEGAIEDAVTQYERYHELFGISGEDGYEMAYAQAQAYKEAGQSRAAADKYREVALYDSILDHREDASYRRVEALGEICELGSECYDELIEAHWSYVELNPDADGVAEMLFAAGELSFAKEDFDGARRGFGSVVERFPGNPLDPESTERIARSYFREDNFADAEGWARKTIEKDPVEETRERALKLISYSIFKEAELAEAAGDNEGAVTHFFRMAKEFPEGDAAQVSLYRGAEALRKLGREEEAAKVYRRIAEEYKSSKYAESSLTLSSEILSSLGDWGGVAVNYEDLYRLDVTSAEAPGHLYRAAMAFEKAGDKARALSLYTEFEEVFPTDGRYAQVLYLKGALLDSMERLPEAEEYYALSWAAPAEGDENVYRAKASLALGEKELARFSEIRLAGDLAAALEAKERSLEKALGHLIDTATLPYAETLAASLYYAGEAFEEMKVALLESEKPEGLSEEELEEYMFLIEEKAFPLEERGIEFYRKGVAAAQRAGAWNEWVERIYARLEALLPWAFQRGEELVGAWAPPPNPIKGWEVKR